MWCCSGQSVISTPAADELFFSSFCCDENFDARVAKALVAAGYYHVLFGKFTLCCMRCEGCNYVVI